MVPNAFQRGSMFRITVQRVQEATVEFVLQDGENPQAVALVYADAGGWETIDTTMISAVQVNE